MDRQVSRIRWMNVRALILIGVLFALLMSPAIVTATHSPADTLAISELALHGHSHDGLAELPTADHDATDHEHQLSALLPGSTAAGVRHRSAASTNVVLGRAGLILQGPRRPPRLV